MYYSKKDLLMEVEESAEKLWILSEGSYTHGSPWTPAQFQNDLMQKNSNYLILTENDQWLGFISYHQVLDEVEFTHVVIHKSFQGLGYGSQLLTYLIHQLTTAKVCQLFLEVRVSNLEAQKLYTKKGFKVINQRKNYYNNPKEDGVVMCLNMKEVSQ